MNTREYFVLLISSNISANRQSNILRPRRMLVPQREALRNSGSSLGHMVKDSVGETKNSAAVLGEIQEDASITPPTISGTITKTFDESFNSFDAPRDHVKPITGCKDDKAIPLLHGESQETDGQKKVQHSVGSNAVSQGNCWSLLFLNC